MLFGKLHPLIVHLPIGIMFLNIVFVFLSRREKYADAIKNILPLTIFLGMASALLACTTGWFLSQNGGYDEIILTKHQWLGFSLAGLSVIIYFLKDKANRFIWLTMTVLLTLTGHFGGTLTHGENYLFADTISKKEDAKKIIKVEDIPNSLIFQDWIQPILKEKCFGCHSATKQKGKLRLDSPDGILKGGEHGAIFKAGLPEGSEMIKRLLLDVNDEHRMPPKGKPQPTVQDIELIKLWISEGGSFEKKIKDLVQTDLVKKLFIASSGVPQNKNNSFLPDIKIEKVADKILDSLKKSGIVVLPIANNSAFLSADFISLPNATDDEVAKLIQVSQQLTWLNLGGTKITDKSLSTIAQIPNLTKLNLNNTNISDGGLAVFPILKNLNYLNLTHTKIGLKGLFALSNPIKLPQLQQLYLFDTKIMLQDSTAIFKLFPKTKVILGSYQVSTLVSDTTVFKRKK